MMKYLCLIFGLLCSPAMAQNPTCPTRLFGDNSNACASTAFVNNSTVPVYYGVPGAAWDGVTNDAAAINARIAAISAAGGGILYLPAKTAYVATAVTLYANVQIRGVKGATEFLSAGVCIGQVTGSQVYNASADGIICKSAPGNTTDAILLNTFQGVELGNITFDGYTSGACVHFAYGGTLNPALPNYNASRGSNNIFNNLHDLNNWFASTYCAYGVLIEGHYTAVVPPLTWDQLSTINTWSRIQLTATTTVFWFKEGGDTNAVYDALLALGANNAVGVQWGDPAFSSAVTDGVYEQFTNVAFTSRAPAASTLTLFKGSSWDFALDVYGVKSDINPTTNTVVPVNAPNALSYCIRGLTLRPSALVPGSGNFFMENYCNGYYGAGNSITLTPTEGSTIYGKTTYNGGGFAIGNVLHYGYTSIYDTLILNPAGPLNAITIELPCNLPNGSLFNFQTTQKINAVTLTVCPGSGDTVYLLDNPITLVPNENKTLRYVASSGYWIPGTGPYGRFGGNISGRNDGTYPSAGFVGEVIGSSVGQGVAVTLASGVAKTITSVSLTAGNWECFGDGSTNPAAGTTQSDFVLGLSSVNNTLPNPGYGYARMPFAAGAGTPIETTIWRMFQLTSPTTIYLVVYSTFAVSTNGGFGALNCIRRS